MEQTPVEKLDEVLNFINTAKTPPFYTNAQIMKEFEHYGSRDMIAIIIKLERDSNIYCENDENHVRRHYPTFDGLLLQQTGGYRQKQIMDAFETKRIESLENNTYRVTLIIAIGTGIAALYYLGQILFGNCSLLHGCK